jgi:GNAT superfamily N-acetyltransferase
LTPEDLPLVDRHLPLARLDTAQTYLVAWDGDLPVGHAHVSWKGTTLGMPEVQDVYVLETHRRRGVGTELTRAAERLAASQGNRSVSLSYGIANDPARLLYEGLGYRKADLPPQHVKGTIVIRGKPVDIDDTLVYLVKDVAVDSGAPRSS